MLWTCRHLKSVCTARRDTTKSLPNRYMRIAKRHGTKRQTFRICMRPLRRIAIPYGVYLCATTVATSRYSARTKQKIQRYGRKVDPSDNHSTPINSEMPIRDAFAD